MLEGGQSHPAEVYILDFAADDYASLIPVVEDEVELLRPFDGSSMAANWQPVTMRWASESGRRSVPDFSTTSGGGLVFSARALDVLGDLFKARGEFLPLDVESGGDWQVMNVTRLSDALNERRSEIKRFRDGGILRIQRHAFEETRLAGETIFKLVQKPAGYDYVTDEFRRHAEQAALTGFLWERRVWTRRAPAPRSS